MMKIEITSKKLPANLATCMTMFLVIVVIAIGIGCVDKDTQVVSESILVKGSDTVLPLGQAEAETFMMENPDKSVTVIGGGSGVGIAALIDGEVDIAMASREMKASEIENARSNGIDPVEHTICWDGIAVVVNPENTVSTLTLSQARGIYNGSISNWEEVGGTDQQIVAISRDSSSGTYEYFKENVLEGDEYRPDALIQSATGAIVLEVSQNRNAVGYIGIAYLDEAVKAIGLTGDTGSVLPSEETVKTGAYPLARPLYFYTNGEPTGLAKTFLDFVLGPDGQGIVSEVGYIPV
jgi:phosphate transport system substrate-binding protein